MLLHNISSLPNFHCCSQVWEETRWRSLPGSAKDCGIGCDGELWYFIYPCRHRPPALRFIFLILLSRAFRVISHHNQIFRWDVSIDSSPQRVTIERSASSQRGEDAWRRVNGEAVGISVGDKEHVYARTAQGTVWHWNTEHQQWRQVRDGKRQPLSLCFDFSCGKQSWGIA